MEQDVKEFKVDTLEALVTLVNQMEDEFIVHVLLGEEEDIHAKEE